MDPLLPNTGRRSWNTSLLVSMAAHAVVFALMLLSFYHAPTFVKASLVAQGEGGKVTLIYSPSAPAVVKPKKQTRQDSLTLKKNALQFAPRNTGTRAPKKENQARPVEEVATSVRAGSFYGSMYADNTDGPVIRPAIPQVFPDPPRVDIPSGVEGDVVVELTIDETGNVTDARLLKGVGHGIDEQVIATLRTWRFRPATKDGSPIPSKQDYKHHFPS